MVRPRGKVALKFIENPRSRRTTFANRIKGLKNKLYEFTTLCDVKACFICYGCDGELVKWPEDDAKIRQVIEKDRRMGDKRREINMADICDDRMKKLEKELGQTRRKNAEFLYPNWDTRLDQLTKEGFRDLGEFLEDKLEKVRQRIEFQKFKEAADLKPLDHQPEYGFHDQQLANFVAYDQVLSEATMELESTIMGASHCLNFYQTAPLQAWPSPSETMPAFGFQPYMPDQFFNAVNPAIDASNYSSLIFHQTMPTPQSFTPTYRIQPRTPMMLDQGFVTPDTAQDLDYMINGLFPANW